MSWGCAYSIFGTYSKYKWKQKRYLSLVLPQLYWSAVTRESSLSEVTCLYIRPMIPRGLTSVMGMGELAAAIVIVCWRKAQCASNLKWFYKVYILSCLVHEICNRLGSILLSYFYNIYQNNQISDCNGVLCCLHTIMCLFYRYNHVPVL